MELFQHKKWLLEKKWLPEKYPNNLVGSREQSKTQTNIDSVSYMMLLTTFNDLLFAFRLLDLPNGSCCVECIVDIEGGNCEKHPGEIKFDE